MRKNTTKTALVIFFLSFNGLFAQLSLKEIPLQEQIDNSTLVVEGEVVSKHSFWSNNLIYTANTVKVYKVFKGESVTTIDVITLGGTVGLEALIVSSSLKLQKGNVGVFVLESSNITDLQVNKVSNKQYRPYGAIQGFYKYDVYSDIAVNPFNKKKGISSSFYKEITSVTHKDYVEVSSFNAIDKRNLSSQNKTLAPSISNFTPTTATAGTKTQLTINGSGFGATMGKVGFSDADNGGGGVYVDALNTEIISWSDTQIVVEIPSSAGTGKIRVTDASSASTISSGDLTISYSELNVVYDPDDNTSTGGTNGPMEPYAYSTQHYGQTVGGGYEWKMQTDFFNDTEYPGAKAAFERAFESWRCTTLINWTIAGFATTTDVAASDSTNVIRFDNGSELPSGVLGTCYSWYQGCGTYPNLNWFVSGLDIVFDAGGTTDWNFGPGATTVFGEYDFESVAIHELGHGHQLGHVIDTNAIMHYALSFNEDQRTLTSNDITAATDVQTRSTTNSICGLDLMTDYAGSCSLGVEDNILKDAVKIYPNPSNGKFYISNESYIHLTKAVVHDLSGRVISEFDISGNAKTKTIDLSGMSSGIYLVNIHSDKAFATKKLVLE